jgi:predicted nucleic acid-binding protein
MDSTNEADAPPLPRAFTDASVLVSASISERGTAFDLFTAARQGLLVLIASTHALMETERNLYRKKPDLGSRTQMRRQPGDATVAAFAVD